MSTTNGRAADFTMNLDCAKVRPTRGKALFLDKYVHPSYAQNGHKQCPFFNKTEPLIDVEPPGPKQIQERSASISGNKVKCPRLACGARFLQTAGTTIAIRNHAMLLGYAAKNETCCIRVKLSIFAGNESVQKSVRSRWSKNANTKVKVCG
jgi:hypothetical protein